MCAALRCASACGLLIAAVLAWLTSVSPGELMAPIFRLAFNGVWVGMQPEHRQSVLSSARAAGPTLLRPVSPEEVAQYQRRGFVHLKKILPRPAIAALDAFREGTLAQVNRRRRPQSNPFFHGTAIHDPELASALLRGSALVQIGRAVLSNATRLRYVYDALLLNRQHIKEPQRGFRRFHIDGNFRLWPPSSVMTLFVPLVNMAEGYGCTEFLPQDRVPPHLEERLRQAMYTTSNLEPTLRRLGLWSTETTTGAATSTGGKGSRATEIVCPARGDVLLFSFEIAHRSLPPPHQEDPPRAPRASYVLRLATDDTLYQRQALKRRFDRSDLVDCLGVLKTTWLNPDGPGRHIGDDPARYPVLLGTENCPRSGQCLAGSTCGSASSGDSKISGYTDDQPRMNALGYIARGIVCVGYELKWALLGERQA